MNLAYVDKLAKVNNGVKYLLVRPDLSERTVDTKRMKKDCQETARAFIDYDCKKEPTQNMWVDERIEFAGGFRKLRKAEGIEIYSTVSETEAAFAERTIRSLKNILYHYMEDYGYKYIHTLSQVVTALISRRNCYLDLIPKDVKISDFLSILYSNPWREYRKPKVRIGDRSSHLEI